ncbi:hypothetical protein BLOT_007057 [Blomia tropicalis]|nr:hypothetical protein BLOT_007057 [Blomia tropicalis]
MYSLYKQTNRCFKFTSPIRRGFFSNAVGQFYVFHEDHMVSIYETGELGFQLLEKKPVDEYFQCEEESWFFPQVVYVLLFTTAAFCCFMFIKTKWKSLKFIRKYGKKVKSAKTPKSKSKIKSQKSRKTLVQKSSPKKSISKTKSITNATSVSKSKIRQSSKIKQHKSLKPNPSSTKSISKSKTPITSSSS